MLALEPRHGWIAIEQRQEPQAIAFPVTEREELVSLGCRRPDAKPSRRADIGLEPSAQPLEMCAARRIESHDDPLVPIVRVCLLRGRLNEGRDVAVTIQQPRPAFEPGTPV